MLIFSSTLRKLSLNFRNPNQLKSLERILDVLTTPILNPLQLWPDFEPVREFSVDDCDGERIQFYTDSHSSHRIQIKQAAGTSARLKLRM